MASKIETQVMASVGTIYTVRRLVSVTALKLYVCVAALFGLGKLVWVSRVFENFMQAGLENSLQFALAAVSNTDLWVQLALLALVVAAVSLVRDLVRMSAVNNRLAF